MAKRQSERLEPLQVARLIKAATPGRYPDGWGLYLVIEQTGSARWALIYRSRTTGRRREMGLGSAGSGAVSLKRAREKAVEARALLDQGLDPIAAKRASAAVLTFGELADQYLAMQTGTAIKSKTGLARAKRALEHYCKPIRALKADAVNVEAVLSILKPIWTEKPETASKVRGYIESVLDAAKARGMRSGDNPAAWKGNLAHLLAKQDKRDKGHHASMSRDALPGFLEALRGKDATSARALEFQILTAARPGEAIEAQWDEIDLGAKLWMIPGERMKEGETHRVPLSPRALEILAEMAEHRTGPYVFPGAKKDRPLSGAAFERLMTRMNVTDATPHGFRSTFRTWVQEVSSFPRELGEAALSHKVGDATERAYARGDALDKRRKMMTAWATFCAPAKGNVTQFRKVVA